MRITRYDFILCVIKNRTQGQRNIHISRLTPPQTYPIYCEVWWYKSSERPQYLPQRCHPYESLPTRNWNQRNIHHHSQTVGVNPIVSNFFNRTYFLQIWFTYPTCSVPRVTSRRLTFVYNVSECIDFTHVQLLFTCNPFSLFPILYSFEYLLKDIRRKYIQPPNSSHRE